MFGRLLTSLQCLRVLLPAVVLYSPATSADMRPAVDPNRDAHVPTPRKRQRRPELHKKNTKGLIIKPTALVLVDEPPVAGDARLPLAPCCALECRQWVATCPTVASAITRFMSLTTQLEQNKFLHQRIERFESTRGKLAFRYVLDSPLNVPRRVCLPIWLQSFMIGKRRLATLRKHYKNPDGYSGQPVEENRGKHGVLTPPLPTTGAVGRKSRRLVI
ncbi:Uncharacterized protein PBTT_06414 [Plasmodiophora brassicae]